MTNEIKISIRAYAKQLHVDEKAVRKAIADGKIKKGFDKKTKKVIASIANKEWGFIHEVPKAQRGVSKAKVADKLNKKKAINKDDKSEENSDPDEKDFSYTELIKEIKISPTLQYQEAIRRKEILAIAREKMELEELQGNLVRKADVEKALYAIGDQLKKSLLNIPARCMDDIIASPNKVEANNILTLEINQVLQSISQLQPV
jgi:hypothetical protein